VVNEEVERLSPEEDYGPDFDEAWGGVFGDSEVHTVHALRGSETGEWLVEIWAAEFVREEPLVSTMFDRLRSALLAVPGVESINHVEREILHVNGSPSGEGLVRAAGGVIDLLADQINEVMNGL
jgi:hypothetical protein